MAEEKAPVGEKTAGEEGLSEKAAPSGSQGGRPEPCGPRRIVVTGAPASSAATSCAGWSGTGRRCA